MQLCLLTERASVPGAGLTQHFCGSDVGWEPVPLYDGLPSQRSSRIPIVQTERLRPRGVEPVLVEGEAPLTPPACDVHIELRDALGGQDLMEQRVD